MHRRLPRERCLFRPTPPRTYPHTCRRGGLSGPHIHPQADRLAGAEPGPSAKADERNDASENRPTSSGSGSGARHAHLPGGLAHVTDELRPPGFHRHVDELIHRNIGRRQGGGVDGRIKQRRQLDRQTGRPARGRSLSWTMKLTHSLPAPASLMPSGLAAPSSRRGVSAGCQRQWRQHGRHNRLPVPTAP